MATCAVLGQALGTAVAKAIRQGCAVDRVDIRELQQTLMEDDCYIPWHTRTLPDLTKNAGCSADVVRNGIDRGEENLWTGREGDFVEYTLDEDTEVSEIRLVFDNDMNRDYYNMPCNYPLVETRFKLPKTLIKEYRIEGVTEDGTVLSLHVTDNHLRFIRHAVDWRVKELRFLPISTHGCEEFRLFDFEVK